MNRPVSGKEKKSVRLHVLLEPGDLEELDAWRYDNRVPTRGEAVRRLIRLGLEAGGTIRRGAISRQRD